jgi:hypothetical protein
MTPSREDKNGIKNIKDKISVKNCNKQGVLKNIK